MIRLLCDSLRSLKQFTSIKVGLEVVLVQGNSGRVLCHGFPEVPLLSQSEALSVMNVSVRQNIFWARPGTGRSRYGTLPGPNFSRRPD